MKRPERCLGAVSAVCWVAVALGAVWAPYCLAEGGDRFVNFESPQVHPLDLSPGGALLAACNSANGTVDLFSVASGAPVFAASVPVGIDPASVRFRTDGELWVTNWISDSVSIVDVAQRTVVRTLLTRDEPADVAFAAGKAFVTCSQPDAVLVYDLADLDKAPTPIRVKGKFPRALAVSEDGKHIYAAIFQSGNKSTLLAHDFHLEELKPVLPEQVVSRPDGPHEGQNPPFNGQGAFVPPLAPGLPPPPATDLIVKQDAGGAWRDDSGADWTRFVSGADAKASGRVAGWHLADHDVAVLDTDTLALSYVSGLMNICMALAVRPGTGEIAVVGTDAINEVRFEPNVVGRAVKTMFALTGGEADARVADLNAGHLDYQVPRAAQELRAMSLGEPRAMVWNADGSEAWIAGMGSNSVVRVDGAGARVGGAPIAVGEGPMGLAMQAGSGRLFVLCRFAAQIDTIDMASGTVLATMPLYDPTPQAIRAGRPVLFDTVTTSGLGQMSCASCHVDARTDGLAWDLGDPQGAYKSSAGRNIRQEAAPLPADDYHPMKGPRTTQTLQDIIGHEPFHWQGDRDGLEAFSDAFQTLLGDDAPLAAEPMSRLKAFLATIVFPPNPYRNLDNSLPEHIDLSDMPAPPAEDGSRPSLPPGNARRGLDVFMTPAASCSECHTVPSGRGTPLLEDHFALQPVARGLQGERHLRVTLGANTRIQTTYKMPPFAPVYEKGGLDYLSADGSTAGFGFFSAGAVDSLFRFALSMAAIEGELSHQDRVDLVALLLAWGGSDMPRAQEGTRRQPPGMAGQDSHASLGQQVTLRGAGDDLTRLVTLRNAVDRSDRIELIAKGRRAGQLRGWWYHETAFEADGNEPVATFNELVAASGPETETTFTVVAAGTGRRLGIDRDLDGVLDAEDATLDAVALDAGDGEAAELDCPTCEITAKALREGDTICLALDGADGQAFQWSRDGRVFSNSARVSGAFCDRFQIRDATGDDSGVYRVDYVDATKALRHEVFQVEVAVAGIPAGACTGPAAALLLAFLGARRIRRSGSLR